MLPLLQKSPHYIIPYRFTNTLDHRVPGRDFLVWATWGGLIDNIQDSYIYQAWWSIYAVENWKTVLGAGLRLQVKSSAT